jgi:predicted secreted protein
MKQTLQFRILSLQVIKRSLVILCMALFANSMSIHAQTINLPLVQDAFWDEAFDPGVAAPTPFMTADYRSLVNPSIVTNYVGTSIPHLGENKAQAALKFTLPQSGSVLSKAKLFFKVMDIQGSPTATVTLTDDNNWMQTTSLATSKFPTLSNASALLTDAPVSSTGWFSLYLPTSALGAKIVPTGATDATLIITGSTAPFTYFNFVADDDASGNKAYLRITFKPQVQSVTVPANNTYKIGDVLTFTVSFDSLINVTGTPKLPITLNTGGTVRASYVAGSGSQNLVFRYTVASGDLDMDGVTVGSAIELNGGTISSDFGEDAELNLYYVGATTGVRVEGTIPTISGVSPPGNATYIAGQNLDYTVNFSEAVNVVTTGGAPYLTLTIGSTTAHATYISGTGTTALVFRHTIVPTDYDVDGIALASNITLNGGTIKDGAGNSATLSFTGSTATGVQIGTAPTVTTVTPSTISSSTATLIGTVNPNNISTTVTFEYGTSTSYGSSTTAIQSPVTGTTATAVSSVIYGLVPNTTYHFRVKGVNTAGTTNGTDLTFTTSAAAPTATSTAASSISGTAATLNGTINAKNASTTVTFEYGLNTSYGTIVTADQSPVTGSTATTVSKAITGLTPGTTYYYRVVGVNAGGRTNGSGKSFTTPLLTGNGTPADPYQIGTLADLKWVAEHTDIWNSSFVQTADIDASITSTWNIGKGFSPIGNVTTKFTGSYNGQYHTITGLTINRSDEYNVGLFGVTTNAILKNIALLDCSTIGQNNVGGLVGYMGYNSTLPSSISDCYCTGNVSGTEYVSGLVGANQSSSITNSYSACNVTATTNAAGLVSFNMNSTIANCFYDKNTSGQSDTGKGTPKTTAEMKTQSTFTGWDFAGETANGTADIWAISSTQNNGYPCFKSQITSPTAPTVTTQAVTAIATTTATGNGNITGLGVPNPGSHGVCWGTSANPTIIDNTVMNKGAVSATGAFSAPITGLIPNTLYHVRAYATNSTNTVYGDDVSFTTQSTSQTISFGALDTKTYGDVPYNLTATSTAGLPVSYSSDNTAVARVSGSTVTIVGAGTANITATQAGTAVCAPAANVIQQLTINKKALSVTARTDTKFYDGTTVSTAIPTVGTLATDDAINVAPAQTFDNATVGATHVLTASGLTIKNGSADVTGNYDISYATATGTINKLGVTVTAVADTKTYDGTTVSTAIPTVGTLANGDAINTAPIQVFDNATVGTTHVLTALGLTIKNGSADVTGNYDISYATATGTINKKSVTVTAATDTKTYDGTTVSTAIPTVGTLATGDAINIASTQVFDNAAVGTTHVLTASGLTIKNGSADVTSNYDISYATVTGTINKLAVTVTATADTKTYDGTTVSIAVPTVGALAAGDAINVVPTQAFDNAAVGTTHVLTASGLTIKNGSADITGNYDISYATATGTINKLGVTVTAATDTKTYDGTTVSTAIPTVGTLATGDAVNIAPTQVFDNAAVGTTHVLTASGLTLKNGTTDVTSNYDISYASATGTINKLGVTVTAVADTKTYDGTTVSTVAPTVGTLAACDAINVAPTQIFDNATVGTTHVLTASGLTIKNGSTDATGNYDISYTTATGTINKMAVTVTAAADTKTYDGTTVSVAVPTVGTLATGDAINVTPTQAFDNAAVGTTHVLTASGLTIKKGSADVTGNYDISYVSANGNITPKSLTITAPTLTLSKVYDGNNVATSTVGTLSGVVASDAGKVTVTAVASYDNATVGTNKAITIVYRLGGSAAGNYSAPADLVVTGAEISSGSIVLEPLSNPTPSATNNDLVLSYNVVAGGPTQYKITFEAAALAVGMQNVSYTVLATTGADGRITISVPKGTRPGKYKGTLQLKNDSGVESAAYDFVITVNIPTEYIAVKYNRVLVLDNSTRMFSAYQWFKDGVAIDGATKQFYSDPKGLVGTYSIQATTTDGEILYSYPKVLNIPPIKKVTAYPSLVRANQTCTVEITDEAMELDLTGANLSVYSSQGIRVYYSTKVEKLNTIKLPTIDGTYSGRVTTADGQSFLFKVIVAN